MSGVDIHCPACRRDTFLKRTPRYDGFRKVGDELSCSFCGHKFAAEADVPFNSANRPNLFADDDRPAAPKVFDDHSRLQVCRLCRHYVVNPFVQRCALRSKLVEATDSCDRFQAKPGAAGDAGEAP